MKATTHTTSSPSFTTPPPREETSTAPDFVESFLAYGRLVDLPVYQHFRALASNASTRAMKKTITTASGPHPSFSLAATCSEALQRVQTICAMHLTQQTQWDGLLLQNTAMQARLTTLACWQFGLDSLRSYVSQHQEELKTSSTSPEVIALQLYTEMAMREGAQLARDIIGENTRLAVAIPHRYSLPTAANTEGTTTNTTSTSTTTTTEEGKDEATKEGEEKEKVIPKKVVEGDMIDYPYLQSFLEVQMPSLFLHTPTRVFPPMEEQVFSGLLPLFSLECGESTGSTAGMNRWMGKGFSLSSLWSNLMGMTSGGRGRPAFRLHAPPLLLQHTAGGIEQQLTSFSQWIRARQSAFQAMTRGEMPVPSSAGSTSLGNSSSRSHGGGGRFGAARLGMCVAEMFSTVAVFHRSAAAVVESEGQHEGRPTSIFSNSSSQTTPGDQAKTEKEEGEDVSQGMKMVSQGASIGTATSNPHLETLFANASAFFANQRVKRWMKEVEVSENLTKKLSSTHRASAKSRSPGEPAADGSSSTEKRGSSMELFSIDGSATHPIVLASFGKK